MFNTANETHYTLDIQGITNSNKLQVLAFDGIEAINSSYIFEVTLVSNHLRYDITQLLSKNAFLSFTPDKVNGIHGIILFVKRGAVGKDYSLFKIILAPRCYHLNHETQQRAFIDKSVIEIISIVLTEKGYQQGIDFEFKLKEDYPKREFCCQYSETTAHYIYRLCQEEGVNIYYQHSTTNHKLIITDNNNFFPSFTNSFQYLNDTGLVADYPVFKRFDINLSSATTTASYRNFNFETAKIPEGSAQGIQNEKANYAIEPNFEFYDYPQKHLNQARGEHYAKIEIERLRANHILGEAHTDISTLHSGYVFSLSDYPVLDSLDTIDKWLITQIYHQARQPQVLEALGSEASAIMQEPALLFKYYTYPINEALQFPFDGFKQGYRNFLISIPHTVTIRPQRLHKKPKVLGTQTAIVTGATGEEIYCNEYGQIKIRFHWDRINPANENSSHWVRVASNWAGNGYGAVIIPRVGMEVVIDFLEGDVDNPIVIGCLHNGINKLPYELPPNKTRSVFKTSSSKGGIGSNELRIEDKTNQEQIFIQAQKDFDQLTKNNHTVQINNNSHLQVQGEHSQTIIKNRYTKNKAEEHHLTNLDRKTQILQTTATSDEDMNKLKLKYFIALISLLLIGWTIYMLTANRIYMYDVMEEELVDVTSYYHTGKFYFYTDPESVTKQRQRLIRRQRPMFWEKEIILNAINNKTIPITYLSDEVKNQEQVIAQIITAFPDFSERMQYYSSYVSYTGELEEKYIGFFTLDDKEYTLTITELSDTANKTNFNDLTELDIDLSTDFFPFPSSYEQFVEEAKKQPQPPL